MLKFKRVGVQFDDAPHKIYYYNTLIDLNIDDIVVVQSRDSISLARVFDNDCESERATKFVVCKVDMESFEETLDKLNKQTELEEKIKRHYEEVNKFNLYEKLAQEDETMRQLLEEYKAIR